jgi:antitoxin component YwqK of YwqJK toxin-antitoxin module
MKKYLLFSLLLVSCHKKPSDSHLISLQMIDRNGQTETISQTARIKVLEKQDFLRPQPYERILRVYSKNEESKNPSILTTYHKNGQLFQKLEALDGRAFGRYQEFYESGQIRIDAFVIEGTADLTNLAQSSWVFDKLCQIFYPSGQLQAEFFYDRGKRSGLAKYFYENQTLQKKLSFIDDLANGDVLEFDEQGSLIKTSYFEMGKQNGPSQRFSSTNVLLEEEEWKNDLLISGRYYSAKSQLLSEISGGCGIKTILDNNIIQCKIQYNMGKIDGKIEMYDTLGKISESFHIKNNLKHGEEILYDKETSLIKMKIDWQEDSITGIVKTFYNTGQLESQKTYSLNKKNGPSSVFYPTGELMFVETYSQDKLIEGKYYKKGETIQASTVEDGTGKAIFFDEWGGIKQEIDYEKGKIIINDD